MMEELRPEQYQYGNTKVPAPMLLDPLFKAAVAQFLQEVRIELGSSRPTGLGQLFKTSSLKQYPRLAQIYKAKLKQAK